MHDAARRRRAVRKGRERGRWVYIPGEYLEAQGFKWDDPIWYRTWAAPKRPRVVINLYREA